MGKLTKIGMFNSYVKLPEGILSHLPTLLVYNPRIPLRCRSGRRVAQLGKWSSNAQVGRVDDVYGSPKMCFFLVCLLYPLVDVNKKTKWTDPPCYFHGKTHELSTGLFSITRGNMAIFNYQRVSCLKISQGLHPSLKWSLCLSFWYEWLKKIDRRKCRSSSPTNLVSHLL